jgi:hypothetical protein
MVPEIDGAADTTGTEITSGDVPRDGYEYPSYNR